MRFQFPAHAIALISNFYLNSLQVFSDDNQPLERNDSHSSTSALDSPLCRPLHASSAARQVPPRLLDDDDVDDEGCRNVLVRSLQSYGQPRFAGHITADNASSAMPRVGSAPPEIGDSATLAPRIHWHSPILPFSQPTGLGLPPAAGAPLSTPLPCALHRRLSSLRMKEMLIQRRHPHWQNASPSHWTTSSSCTSLDRCVFARTSNNHKYFLVIIIVFCVST
jgi:hypothetical protein